MYRLQRVADDRFAVAVGSTAEGQLIAAQLRHLPHCIDAVGAIAAVECRFDIAATSAEAFRLAAIEALDAADGFPPIVGKRLEIPVRYGGEAGPDLAKVCAALGLSNEDFVARHTSAEYTVAMLGFTPGFVYLDGMDSSLSVPRRELPRQLVPAGSVGIAGGRTGIYGLQGPGGWQIIGCATEPLFDAASETPSRVGPGDTLRLVEVTD